MKARTCLLVRSEQLAQGRLMLVAFAGILESGNALNWRRRSDQFASLGLDCFSSAELRLFASAGQRQIPVLAIMQ